jgi:predicted acetyltransferase
MFQAEPAGDGTRAHPIIRGLGVAAVTQARAGQGLTIFWPIIELRGRGGPTSVGGMSDLEIRLAPESDIDQMIGLTDFVFHSRTRDGQDRERARWWFGQAVSIGAYEDDRLVGLLAALPQRISVPGGDLGCGAVTGVGVLPTHRRRGILTGMMDRFWTESAARDWPVAALWASEAVIYGRYGYGNAAPCLSTEVSTVRPLNLRIEPDPRPLRLVDPDKAVDLLDPIYERYRARRTGGLARDPEWWRQARLRAADDDHSDHTLPRVVVMDGEPGGYAVFRTSHKDETGGTIHLTELIADTPQIEAALWRFLSEIDLTERIECWPRPLDDPLHTISGDLGQIKTVSQHQSLWLRLTDLRAALERRRWSAPVDLVLDVRDDRIPANHGHWRLRANPEGAVCERTDGPADVTVQIRDLAAAYLAGGVPVATAVRDGLAAEHTPGAARTLDIALATPYGPHLLDEF